MNAMMKIKRRARRITIAASVLLSAAICAIPASAGQWKEDTAGWWWQEDDGSCPRATWKYLDGRWYYFHESGYMAANQWIDGTYYVGGDGAMLVDTTTPDGYRVGSDGAWDGAWQRVREGSGTQLTILAEKRKKEDNDHQIRIEYRQPPR